MLKIALAALVAAALPAAAAAQSQRLCITPEQNRAFVAGMLPDLMNQAARRCSPLIGPDAFLSQQSANLAERFRPASRAAQSSAVALIERITGQDFPNDPQVIATGRMFLAAAIASNLDERQCQLVSRLSAELAPLPPGNFIGVFALFLEAGLGEQDQLPFQICPRER